MSVKELEKPLPKPSRDLAGYASARVLEALLESVLALEFLEQGYTRNAAEKVFQAWKALIGALLALERESLLSILKNEEERRWLEEKALLRIPTTRLKTLSHLLEEAGYRGFTAYTVLALDLHDYQYHGPDPDMELSKYPNCSEVAKDILYVLERLEEIVVKHVKPKLESRKRWLREHVEALNLLKERMNTLKQRYRGFPSNPSGKACDAAR